MKTRKFLPFLIVCPFISTLLFNGSSNSFAQESASVLNPKSAASQELEHPSPLPDVGLAATAATRSQDDLSYRGCGCALHSGCAPTGCCGCFHRHTGASDSTCNAEWDGAYWKITAACGAGCRCDLPPLSFAYQPPTIGSPPIPGTFGCITETNATSERFFMSLTGKETGIHHVCFDKSNVELFDKFKIKIMSGTTVAWQIEARWNPGSNVAIPTAPSPLNPSHEGTAVITCDTLAFGDVSQTFSLAQGTSGTSTCAFGHWTVEITYRPPSS